MDRTDGQAEPSPKSLPGGHLDALFPELYVELRGIARAHRLRHGSSAPFSTTALVNDAYLRLRQTGRVAPDDRAHFLALSARVMRFVLTDYARRSLAETRDRRSATDQGAHAGGATTADHAESMLALHEALEAMSAASERMARVVECRFFGGLSEPEIAEVLAVSDRTVRGDWQRAKIWLALDLGARSTSRDPGRWRDADALLAAALERPPSERRQFVEARADDAATAALVLSLLEHEQNIPEFLDRDAVEHALPFLPEPEEPAAGLAAGDRVGAYRLVEEIGRGGMGVVFLAERDDGRFQKRVAIKVLPVPPSFASPHLAVWFQSEREILAQLEHPAIARLLDGGETNDGQPYLVMEYVEGERIDAYCDRRRLAVEARIALFLAAAEAVAYAHQNLVVHRDIKPSNVLVSASGEVKLLDFGIAKVLPSGAEAPSRTLTHERAMTPAYASPEQVRGDPIRTVSDVYSLGVLLYELLTGRRPYRTGPLPHELATAILDQEPIRPSAAVADGGTSETRDTTPGRLRSRLRGDLDAIVLKALRKHPERRYQSVEALLGDLRCHLEGAPVAARGDDRWYRLGRFARRRWPALAATAALLVLGGSSAAFHARRIEGERDVARREAATAQAVTGFVVSLFEASNAWGDSPQAFPDKITARDLLDQGTKRIRTELSDQPEVRAELLSRLGSIHSSLGLHDQAESLLTEALALRRRLHGPGSKAVADDLDRLSWVYFRKGDYLRAESCDRQAYEIRRRRFGPDSAEAAASLHKIGLNLRKLGKLAESELAFRTALANLRRIHGDENRDVALAMKGLAMIRRDRGDLVEAESLARQALEVSRRLFGDRHSLTTEHRSDLATILRTKGDLDGAESLARRALEDSRSWFGDEHPNVALRWSSLGLVLRQKKDLPDAEHALREALRLNEMFLGQEHPNIASNLHNLAGVLRDEGDLVGAEVSFERALAMRRRILPADHPDTAATMTNLAQVALDRKNLPRAAALYQELLDSLRRNETDQTRAAGVEMSLGRTLVGLGRPQAAEPLLRKSLRTLEKVRPATDPAIAVGRAALGQSLLDLGRREEAERLIAQALHAEGMKTRDQRFVEMVSRQLAADRARAARTAESAQPTTP